MTNIINSACLVCRSKEIDHSFTVVDYLVSKEKFVINECRICGFKFLKNPPPEEKASVYYETEEYIEHSDSSEGLINKIYHFARKWMFRYKYRIIRNLNRGDRILDFGTGTGYFLNYMNTNDFKGIGIEISEKARNYGKEKFHLDIRSPDKIFDHDFPGDFGYITFWHVLEHIYNPEEVLKKVSELLSENGVLLIALPNHKCLDEKYYKKYWAAYDVPRHLWHWDKESFIRFANRLGFKLIKTKMLPLDPFYNCLISESYRKKKWAHILIPFIGSASLLQGLISNDKASSIIYILEKA